MYTYKCRHAFVALTLVCGLAVAAGTAHLSAALIRVSPYLSRAEAVTILLLASPAPLPKPPASHPYVDVLPTDWFRATALAGAKLGLLSPDATGTKLRPFGSVNRAAFLKMLTLAFGLPVHQRHGYTDVPATSWFAPYAGTEATYHLFTHAAPSKLEPDRLVTQEEARIALQVFLQLRSKAEEEEATKTAIAQASGQVQLYTVISTKRLRVVLVNNPSKPMNSVAKSPPKPEHIEYYKKSSTSSKTTDDIRAEVLALVNTARANVGLHAVQRNASLEKSAQAYADQMHRENFFGHTDPNGKTLQDRVDVVGYYSSHVSSDCQCIKSYALGENLARGQRSADEVVRSWMDSPSHREAILEDDFTDIGIGIQSGVWVQHFGGALLPGTK